MKRCTDLVLTLIISPCPSRGRELLCHSLNLLCIPRTSKNDVPVYSGSVTGRLGCAVRVLDPILL